MTMHIGQVYLQGTDATPSMLGTPDHENLLAYISAEYKRLIKDRNIQIYYSGESADPNLKVISDRYLNNKQIEVFDGGSKSELLPGCYNLMFRAIHDVMHVEAQQDFDLPGETATYYHTVKQLAEHQPKRDTPMLRSILYSEIVLQVGAYDLLGGYPDTQKLVLLPV